MKSATRHFSLLLLVPTISGLATGLAYLSRSAPLFDSAHTILLDLKLPSVVIESPSTSTSVWDTQIRRQLKFLLGQFAHHHSGAQIGDLDYKVIRSQYDTARKVSRIEYSVDTTVAWDKSRRWHPSVVAVLPARGSPQALTDFYKQYAATCSEKGADTLETNFFYYFRPHRDGCVFKDVVAPDSGAIAVNGRLSLSQAQTSGKYPEYGKLWEDGKLAVTMVFGLADVHKWVDGDQGLRSYNDFHSRIVSRFGPPVRLYPRFEGVPGPAVKQYVMTFQTPSGTLEIHSTLIPDPRKADETFITEFKKRILQTDVLIYNGHAGLGANIEALSRMIQVRPGQYLIAAMNGCNTYAYMNDMLLKKVEKANPGAAGTKYLDIISNAMPSYFLTEYTSVNLIDALVRKQKTYREILSEFDPRQKVVVTGEEDNNWPRPF